MGKSLSERFWEMKFGLQRSFYYYEARLSFWEGAKKICEIANVVILILCLFNVLPGESKIVIGTLLTLIGTTLGGEKHIKTLRDQKRAMGDCLSMIPYLKKDATEQLYKEIKRLRETAEREDNVLFETLDAMCDNKARMTLGVPARYQISAVRSFLGWWLPLPYPKNMQLIDKNQEQRS